jgi:glutamate-5-semialdehyde dehydrogenase
VRQIILRIFVTKMNLTTQTIHNILLEVKTLLFQNKEALFAINKTEMESYNGNDTTLLNRLKIDEKKLQGMLNSLQTVAELPSPINQLLYSYTTPDNLLIENRTAPFGTILIIYESRPDVTIEAAAIAFKSGNKIILKGGKESHKSNQFLVNLWHKALEKYDADVNFIQYLELNREETQEYLQTKQHCIDLVIPRGGENLIKFVQQYSNIPLLISGRGNNFIYIDENVDNEIILPILINAKTTNISACNALDKVIFHEKWIENNATLYAEIMTQLQKQEVEIIYFENETADTILYDEFLAKKIVLIKVGNINAAIKMINKYSGKHSTSILSNDKTAQQLFLVEVDCAAVSRNASTRLTDGGQFGLGAEMAISTSKLHHRGPLGLQHLVTNKWIIKGNGHIRN